jgi:hypothetical protein
MLWGYLFSNNSPRTEQTIVVQPDGREVVAKPVKEGVDGLLILNWIMLVVIVVACIAGLMWLVNKYTKKQPPTLNKLQTA